jgi:hypothetical protein
MKENNIILEKTFVFGLRIIKLFKHLLGDKVERDFLSATIEKWNISRG